MDSEIQLEILDVLESNGTTALTRLCRLLEFPELEITAALGQLVTKRYVKRSGHNFKITASGKAHLADVRNTE
ncbi:MAG: winged helix DNA-binding protein [Nitrososphaerales archaeon]